MVHLRLNEKETNPNPYVNFITALKSNVQDEEDARNLLRALAAQVKPVMKAHGFSVNSLEEYEYNQVFSGRNWNSGETVELVLRRPDGCFYPNYWLMSTLCHELAHIKHMNHGPGFQALWTRLRAEVRQLQDRGYYGDGYWSSGQRLQDSARVGDNGIGDGDFPEYMCGGAQSRTRPTARRRRQTARGKRPEVVPSLHTGAQTAKKRKAGARVTSKYAFTGEGAALANDGKGTGFGKQAASKRAREERAMAVERRLLGLQSTAQLPTTPSHASTEDGYSEDEVEFVSETDAERRQILQEADQGDDSNQKIDSNFSWIQLKDEFNFDGGNQSSGSKQPLDIIDISSDDDDTDFPVASGSTGVIADEKQRAFGSPSNKGGHSRISNNPGLGKMVQTEIDLRKKESLGMAPVKGGGRILGSKPLLKTAEARIARPDSSQKEDSWDCLVCTLINNSDHRSCVVCTTPRNEQIWKQPG